VSECHGVPLQSAYRALSDPTRREILWILRTGGRRAAADIAARLDAPPGAVGRHLDLLTAAGLVGTQDGTYVLKTSVLADVVLELAELADIGLDVSRADLIDPVDLSCRR
jgi:DNA-binding transcriptional ArsR family regulator